MLDARTLGLLAWRECRTSAIERDDLVQQARLALLEAKAAGRIPADPVHRQRYLVKRARGAMTDWVRREAARAAVDHDASEVQCQGPGPEDVVAAREHLALVRRRLPPWKAKAVDALLAGQDHDPTAVSHGVAAALRVLEGARHETGLGRVTGPPQGCSW